MKKVLSLSLALQLLVLSAVANAMMTYIYNAPESAQDSRYRYQWKILQTALDKTVPKYGAYQMLKAEVMSERRQQKELISTSGKLTVMYLDTNPTLEKKLVPVRIPVPAAACRRRRCRVGSVRFLWVPSWCRTARNRPCRCSFARRNCRFPGGRKPGLPN